MSNCECIGTRTPVVVASDEGTSYYACNLCKKPIDDAHIGESYSVEFPQGEGSVTLTVPNSYTAFKPEEIISLIDKGYSVRRVEGKGEEG